MTAGRAVRDSSGNRTGADLAASRRNSPSAGARSSYAAKVSAIAALPLACSFVVDLDRFYWTLLTFVLVSQATTGSTAWRCLERVVGTLVGAGFALATLLLFARDGPAIVAALTLWIFAVGAFARVETGFDGYAYAASGLTALAICLDAGPNAIAAYDVVLPRAAEMAAGIAATFVVGFAAFPTSAAGVLTADLAEARKGAIELAGRTVADGSEPGVEETRDLAEALADVSANLRARLPKRLRRSGSTRRFADATNRLSRLLVAIERMSWSLADLEEAGPSPTFSETRSRLRELLEAVPPPDAEPRKIVDRAAAFRAAVEPDPVIHESATCPEQPADREASALRAMRRFALATAAYLDAEAAILDPAEPRPLPRRVATSPPDRTAALTSAMRPAIVFGVLAAIWLASANPSLRITTLISTGLCMTLPAIAVRAAPVRGETAFALGLVAMFPPVLALDATLPYVETLPVFALMVGSVFFVFFYLCHDRLLRTYALGGAVLLATAMQSSNGEGHDALAALDALASLALSPLAVVAVFAVIVPENQPRLRRRLRDAGSRLLARAALDPDPEAAEPFAQSLDAIGDRAGDLDLSDPANRADYRRSRAAAAAGLELHELRRIGRCAGPQDPLRDTLDAVGDAIRAEFAAGDDLSVRPRLEAARREAMAIASGKDLGDVARSSALRFAVGMEFLQTLVEEGRLKPAGPERPCGKRDGAT